MFTPTMSKAEALELVLLQEAERLYWQYEDYEAWRQFDLDHGGYSQEEIYEDHLCLRGVPYL